MAFGRTGLSIGEWCRMIQALPHKHGPVDPGLCGMFESFDFCLGRFYKVEAAQKWISNMPQDAAPLEDLGKTFVLGFAASPALVGEVGPSGKHTGSQRGRAGCGCVTGVAAFAAGQF